MYELNKKNRTKIRDSLVQLLPVPKQDEARKTIDNLADIFEGQDMNTVGLLYEAAEVGKFDEYATKLKEYYEQEGKNVSVENRSVARNQNIFVLRDIVAKENQIAEGARAKSDRDYWPNQVQTLAKYLGSVKMELFFANCFREIMKK